ncbi:MAG: LVIVD repeat protein [Candidatus Peregrinibacteria bacterium GW2011_GWA2_33_10]|nr:MAG: LVIVD repeat protein [Candidatus Peregrinibacteria bacterium GW2011_GWA2_33_10]KKP40802.1 MAG: hypothetical protein UR30_C0004G0060 [Candidatus Peregrinibacteria bacterium GW2011_GWC2_33_13]OGJ48037.1 MAG: hypothetical protein A2229_03315 [Candidatus Peregrinibacteria bacterium RIFOXYA2_FULL_33_7]
MKFPAQRLADRIKLIFQKKGQVLLEVLLAVLIFSIITLAAINLLFYSIQAQQRRFEQNAAYSLLRECFEAVRHVRDTDFSLLQNGTFGLNFSSGNINLVAGNEIIDNKYTRAITISDIFRDNDLNIADTGTLDLHSKKAICEISWKPAHLPPRQINSQSILTNWQNNTLGDNLTTEFNQGTLNSVEIINSETPPENNGAITLSVIFSPSGFTSSVKLEAAANDVEVQSNYAFIAVDSNTKGFQVVDISDPQNPSLVKSLNIQTRGACIDIKDNYAFIGTKQASKSLVIVNIADPLNPQIIKTINLGATINDISIKDNFAYLAVENMLRGMIIMDISDPLNPQKRGEALTLGSVNSIAVRDNYAYLANEHMLTGLMTYDISDPDNPESIDVDFIYGKGKGITLSDNKAYMAVDNNTNGLAVISLNELANPQYIRSIDIEAAGFRVDVFGDFIFVSTDKNNAGIAILDKSEDDLNPDFLFAQDIQGKGRGFIAAGEYIYMATTNSNRGFVIIGPPVEEFAVSGDFTSRIFDTGSLTTVYYNLFVSYLNSPGGNLKFQIRTANSYTDLLSTEFIGPDATNTSYYTNPFTKILLPGTPTTPRYFQYRAYFTGDSNSSPILNELQFNFRNN